MYRVTVDQQVQEQIDALPDEALGAYLELRATLELSPWNGAPLHPANPHGVLTWPFGSHSDGLVSYLVLEDQHRVDVVDVQWIG